MHGWTGPLPGRSRVLRARSRSERERALGMRAILIDREERHPHVEERLTDLYGLPAALGLPRPT